VADAGPANLHDGDAAVARSAVAGGALVLLDFGASWCGPCRSLVPVIADLANRHSALTILKVDVDRNAELAEGYGDGSSLLVRLSRQARCLGQKTRALNER
jgi:thiol-disulfide isomerase/thioredoxin